MHENYKAYQILPGPSAPLSNTRHEVNQGETNKPMKQTLTRYSQGHKDEALARVERIGVTKPAKQLGLHAPLLYG